MTVMLSPRLILPLVACLAFLAGCPVPYSDTPISEMRLTDEVTGTRYHVYVPSTYDAARRWPLVVTLHGTHGFDDSQRQAQEWKGLAEQYGFIVLAPPLASPQGVLPVSQAWMTEKLAQDEQVVLAQLADMKRRYSIDERAVLLSSFSAGGYAMYYIGLRHPELFTALAARSCSSNLEAVKAIPLTDQARALPIFIYFGKSGVNPVASGLSPIANESWATYRHLRENKCLKAELKAIDGGHERRPEIAYRWWRKLWPKE